MTDANFGVSFLTAHWRYLAMLNYEIAPEILMPLMPKGTELDAWNGKTLVSMVGFLFLNARVMGVAIPFHRNFEEINLRFYVRRRAEDGWRRGVVFVKEIVPRAAIALTARWLYNENYVALPTGNAILRSQTNPDSTESVKYFWRFMNQTHAIELVARGEPMHFAEGSEEEFIAQHYWGYSSQRDGGTVEYRVDHPPWRIWQAQSCRLECDVERLYGGQFARALSKDPSSAFLAEGSEITVYKGRRIA
ncbi:MAG: YqjF family protein [Chloroflexota bacterium]